MNKLDQILEKLNKFELKVDARFVQIDERFLKIDQRFVKMDKRFDNIDRRLDSHGERFSKIDDRLDQLADYSNLNRKMIVDNSENIMALSQRLDKGFKGLNQKIDILAETIKETFVTKQELDERLTWRNIFRIKF
jgi:predicted  nucleic acid-binding Zn-ribbon protein